MRNDSSSADAFQERPIPDGMADMDMNWFRDNWVQVFEKDIAERQSRDSRVEWLENEVRRLQTLLGQESEATDKMNNHSHTHWVGGAAQAPVHHAPTDALDTPFHYPQMQTGPENHTTPNPFAKQPLEVMQVSHALGTIPEEEQ